jgi:hypothetical protein
MSYLLTSAKPRLLLFVFLFSLAACTKKDIQFANDLGESYTNLVQVDTVSVNLSTFVLDSFATNNISDFVAGRYADSLLGTVKAKAYVQLMPALAQTLEDGAVYDSLCFVIKPNQYSYGDTTKAQTISIHELTAPIEYSYGTSIYNTSSFAEKTTALGSKTMIVYPHLTDSIVVRLDDEKGKEFFTKIQQQTPEMQTSDDFLNYFKGVSINFNSAAPSAVYGFGKDAASLYMRLYYHTSFPEPEEKWKDFSYYSNLSSNQILTDRSGTALAGAANSEVPSSQAGNRAFTQAGTGVLLKLTFPTLRNVLQLGPTVKLLKATLTLNVPAQRYDGKTPLPSSLQLWRTDASNTIGAALYNTDGSTALSSAPVYDNLYDGATYYSFDLTSYINSNLTTSGSESDGLFLMETTPGSSGKINRAVINSPASAVAPSQLVLSLLTIKN